MKNIQPKIQYDSESQVFSIQMSQKKSIDSDIQGNLVVDYDSQGKIVRINIYQVNFENFEQSLKSTQIPFISKASLTYQ